MAKVAFTAARLESIRCPANKSQVFLWDATSPGLGLRVTGTGARAYVFQSRYSRSTVRVTIGSPDTWSLKRAQERARELQTIIDGGRDPRIVIAELVQADVAVRRRARQQSVTVQDAWAAYLVDRRPRWGERHASDHDRLAGAGGQVPKSGVKDAKRKGTLTVAGPLHSFMGLSLSGLDAQAVETWAKMEAARRPTQARLAHRLLKAFLSWCEEQAEFSGARSGPNPAKSRRAREALGRPAVKKDALMREQLPAWFAAMRAWSNPMHAVYVQALLLCGCRPSEMLQLRWEDVDTRWRTLAIRDKVEGERIIPLTPYVAHLFAGLPRRNENPWVFSSSLSANGCMAPPAAVFRCECRAVGLERLTFHGLRRSFRSLTEWLEVPVGVVAQIQGHKPSATVEKHYTIRPLDLLRKHHERIEAWVLEQAGIVFHATHASSENQPSICVDAAA